MKFHFSSGTNRVSTSVRPEPVEGLWFDKLTANGLIPYLCRINSSGITLACGKCEPALKLNFSSGITLASGKCKPALKLRFYSALSLLQ